MRIQLWSCNYDPEPTGIAPLSAVWARSMRARGHDVSVVAAHPHYPAPVWGTTWMAYREQHDGVPVLRLPLWVGHDTGRARIRQELTFAASLAVAAPLLGRPDIIVAVSPSFPALLPAMINARLRGVPWTMWLQDILPDGAATTDLLDEGPLLGTARRFERMAYRSASRVFVISEAFERNLARKGVPATKLRRIYNPAPGPVDEYAESKPQSAADRLLVMGNIGRSQGLAELVRGLEQTHALDELDVTLRLAGRGVAEQEVEAEIRSDRIKMLGVLVGEDLESELRDTTLALVTQRSDVTEFNLPSKLMNYMAHGLPVLAIVNPESECARIVHDAGAGWVADPASLEDVVDTMRHALGSGDELRQRGRAGNRFARTHFAPDSVAEQYETELSALVEQHV